MAGERGYAVHTERGERFQIRLRAGAALLSEPAMVSATAGQYSASAVAFFLPPSRSAVGDRPVTLRRRRCRWPRLGSLPSLLYRGPLPRATLAACRRKSDHRHRCAGNSQAQFPGKDRRSMHWSFDVELSFDVFRGIYLRRPPCSPSEMSSKVRKNQKRRNRFCFLSSATSFHI